LYFIKALFPAVLCVICCFNSLNAQGELDVFRRWIGFSDAPNSLYHYLASQAYELLDKRSIKVAALRTLPQWKQRQQWLRKTLAEVVGAFPRKTPLNASIVRTVTTGRCKIEHIVYESQPGFFVTSSLFIPLHINKSSKAPTIVYCSGHSNDGYRNAAYQQAILNMVEKGFIVFAFDPVGQGERFEYYDSTLKKSLIGSRDEEHSYAGAQLFINGNSLARYMIWDGIRAIDYLLTRPEVDPARIGITGRSGGGTQSAYIAAFDDRVKAVAPENYITNFSRLIQSSGPQDAEQDFLNGIKKGLDMADLLLVQAPRPILMITTTRDLTFSIQGAIETAHEVAHIFNAYGKKDNFRMVTDDAPHASTKKGREAMYAFFQKNLQNPGDSTDKEIKLLSAEQLQVTKTGQVSTSYNSETVFSLNRKALELEQTAMKYSLERKHDDGPGVVSAAKRISGYRSPLKIDGRVFTGRFQKDGYAIEKYFIKGEGDYVIPYLLFIPAITNHKALIYLNPCGKSAEAAPGGEIEWFVKNGFTVLAPDLIGIGEMGPGSFHGDSYIQGVSYNVWFLCMLIGRSITGIHAADIIKLGRLLKQNKNLQQVYGLAVKELAPALLHAAAFEKLISRVALIEPCISYRSIVINRFYNPANIQSAVPSALTDYDLPVLAATLSPAKLLLVRPRDATGKSIDTGTVNKDLEIIKNGYNYKKAGTRFTIIPAASTLKMDKIYNAWIK
jgi:cephalosporin-C deacetylase-like acetyl esterase